MGLIDWLKMKFGDSPQQRADPFGPEWEDETEFETQMRKLRRELGALMKINGAR